LTDEWWFPLYEKMVELDVPAMIHVAASCNPAFHHTGAHYMNGDTTAFMQLLQHPGLFQRFPTLRFVLPHGGGAIPYHWGRYRGIAQDQGWPGPETLLPNVFFDTCVYDQAGMRVLVENIGPDNVLFASEMIGAVRGIDPTTGRYFDDTKPYLDALSLPDPDHHKIFEANARRVYPRLKGRLG
jgi:4-oxalmesaconate hydratase